MVQRINNVETALILQDIMQGLELTLPGMGIALIIFELDKVKEGHLNWICNSRRIEMNVLLREMIAQFEGNYQPGTDTKQ